MKYNYRGKMYSKMELWDKADNYLNTMNRILSGAKDERRDLTKDEEKDLDQLNKKFDAIMEIIDEPELVGMDLLGDIGGAIAKFNEPENKGWRPSNYIEHNRRAITGGPAMDRSYRGMFCGDPGANLSNGGFNDFEEFLSILNSGRHDPRLIQNVMREGVGSEGGFAVPEEFGAWLLDASLESEIVRPRATIWPMTTETRKIPSWDGSNHSTNLFGGFSGVWLAEAGTATRQTAKLKLLQMIAKKLAIYTQASRELIQDGMSFEGQLGVALIAATGWFMDDAFLNGNGVGKPRGILSDPALITVSKEGAQVADTIIYENIIKMFARMHPACLQKAVWICNQTTLPQLMSLIVSHGVTGTFYPAVQNANGKFYLLGKEIILTEKTPKLGDVGDIILADLSQYAVGLRQDLVVDKSNAPGWTEDLTDYRVIARVDGMGTWKEPVTPKNGDSLSWCVTLEAR